jgi:hypothetical protein
MRAFGAREHLLAVACRLSGNAAAVELDIFGIRRKSARVSSSFDKIMAFKIWMLCAVNPHPLPDSYRNGLPSGHHDGYWICSPIYICGFGGANSAIWAFQPMKGNLGSLQKLRLCGSLSNPWTEPPDFTYEDGFLDIFHVTPSLREVQLQRFYPLNIAIALPRLPWNQLTQCSLVFSHISDCLERLAIAPNLVDCTMFDCWQPIHQAYNVFPPTVSQIRSLHIKNIKTSSAYGFNKFFKSLTLPEVREITVDWENIYARKISQFNGFIQRSAGHLQRVVLRGTDFSESDINHFLGHVPSLVQLEIGGQYEKKDEWERSCYYPHASDGMLKRLTYHGLDRSSSVSLVPNLRSLHLWGCLQFRDEIFLDMVQSRWSQGPSGPSELRCVVLRVHRELDEETQVRLQVWREEGLDIVAQLLSVD